MKIRQRVVVVGGVAAGMSAASKARRLRKDLDIVVFEKSGYVSYGACGFPYWIKGDVRRFEDLIARSREQFAKDEIEVHVRHEVVGVNLSSRRVRVRDIDGGTESNEVFDELLLTTGGAPTIPRFSGGNLRGIFTLRTPEDAMALRRWIDEERPRNAVIVGAGYIGLEMAEVLAARGLAVSIVEMLPQVLPNMDNDMAALVAEELERHGVRLHAETPVEAFGGNERVRAALASGIELPADLVILAMGVRPVVQLAREAGVLLGETGAIAVSDHQRTNIDNVWAAGDVAESMHRVTGKPVWIPLGTTANKQGRVAGENIAGGDASFPGVVGTAVVKVFGLEVARTGLTEREAREACYDIATTQVTGRSRAHYMPHHQPIWVKLVYEKDSQRLLGAQMVGSEGVVKRIDLFAAALQAGWSTNQIAELDLSYAPPFAPVWDPVLVAANVASK